MLEQISARLQQLRRQPSQPFGGVSLLVAGDLCQLPPPQGSPVFAATLLWHQLEVLELEGNHRAAEDPDFAALLGRARLGECTAADYAALRARVVHRWRAEEPRKYGVATSRQKGRAVEASPSSSSPTHGQPRTTAQPQSSERPAEDDAAVAAGTPRLAHRREQVAEMNAKALRHHVATTGEMLLEVVAEDTYADSGMAAAPEEAWDNAEDRRRRERAEAAGSEGAGSEGRSEEPAASRAVEPEGAGRRGARERGKGPEK